MKREIEICQAQPTKMATPQNVHIKITDKKVIECSKSLEAAKTKFKTEAKILHDALTNSLPQGTKHQLLILMLESHRNFLIGAE